MKKYILLIPLALGILVGCTIADRMNYLVTSSTDAIYDNVEAVENSTQVINQNAQIVDESTRTIEENHRHLEKAANS